MVAAHIDVDRFSSKLNLSESEAADTGRYRPIVALPEVLGRRPSDRMEGLAAFERAVAADYERDLERRLRLFHRMEVRKEFLWEPIQRATGFATNHPLTRMNASPSRGDAGIGEERS